MLNRTIILALVVIVGIPACFNPDEPDLPDSESIITIKFYRTPLTSPKKARAADGEELSSVLNAVDSVMVKVYPSVGSGDVEAFKGVGVANGADSIVISLAVSPGRDKRVSVELFEGGRLIYFGVNEHVDVFLGKETEVTIDAFSFELVGFGIEGSYVRREDSFRLFWQPIPSAEAYYVQESTTPDFSNVVYEVALTDTTVTFQKDAGPHYFRVAPFNSYVFGTFCAPRLVYVYDTPAITSVTPRAAARGEAIIINGTSLDYPGNEFYISDVLCDPFSVTPEEAVVVIPPTAFTDSLVVTGPLGSDTTDAPVVVQLVAFIYGTDLQAAQEYKYLIEAADNYKPYTFASGVKIISLNELGSMDMNAFALIILGADTGKGGLWSGGVSGRIDAIKASEAHIIGLGIGGYEYFKEILLYIGQQNILEIINRTAYIFDPDDPIYDKPFPVLNMLPGDILEVYAVDVPQVSVELDTINPQNGVKAHAKVDQGSYSIYHPLVDEKEEGIDPTQTNFLWGFDGYPNDMTAEGRTCFMNIVSLLFSMSTKVVTPLTDN